MMTDEINKDAKKEEYAYKGAGGGFSNFCRADEISEIIVCPQRRLLSKDLSCYVEWKKVFPENSKQKKGGSE